MSLAAERAYDLVLANNLKDAFAAVNEGLNKDPEDMALLMVGASVLSRQSSWGLAYNLLKRVVAVAPTTEVLNNLGMSASSLASSTGKDKYLEEAEALLRKAHRKAPSAEVCANLALVMLHKMDLKSAEQFGTECLKSNPDNVSARETMGYVNLHKGDWYHGFGNFEFALGGKYRTPPKGTYWEPGVKGVKLFLRGEQGLGDEISYASVIPDAAKDNDITFECDHRLAGLFRRSFPQVRIIGERFFEKKSVNSEDYDRVALVGSLFMQYRRTDADFPHTPFLVPDPERVMQWKALLDSLPGKKVGIAWTGGLANTFKHRRSFSLEALLPILKTPGITWVSLQYDESEADIKEFKEKHGIEIKSWPRATGKGVDYDEAAALVSGLDCVVSTTTAMVHLCGALGKKCYVLVPKKNRWWYTSPDGTHRWYDSLELFRQADKWPIEKLADKLKADLCV